MKWQVALSVCSLAASLLSCGARTELLPGRLEPACPSLSTENVRLGEIGRMDLLFVVDNSISMADKQALLRAAVPALVRRLVNPVCVSLALPRVEQAVASIDAPCPTGMRREFEPLDDLHVGVITSSLGSQGGNLCAPSNAGDDRGHLLGTLPRAQSVPTYSGQGFLDWDPKQQHVPAGETDLDLIERRFADLVGLAGEKGCGYEAVLESWYRFLIDPAPPQAVVVQNGVSRPQGVDKVLLAQRAAFLRPDSLLAIVMLSDENDCSIVQHGSGWLVGTAQLQGTSLTLPSGTSACEKNPNGPCCRSCARAEIRPPAGCASLAEDLACRRAPADDLPDLRCFEQKRRFGVDLLYPTARYAVGLRSKTLCPNSIYDDADCTCTAARERARRANLPAPPCGKAEVGAPVQNPLFSNSSGEAAFERAPSQVLLAGILGVPWQDLATDETLRAAERLDYRTASDLATVDPVLGFDRWQLILGEPSLGEPPRDPFMLESVQPRSGENPLTRDRIAPANSTNPLANAINGHEHVGNGGLQYSCIFPLATPRDCAATSEDEPCDCREPERDNLPLCQPPGGGPAGTTQYFAKAYPSLRELDVLRQHGSNSVVASICPKARGADREALAFGYGPAVAGLIKRLHCTELNATFDTSAGSPAFGSIDCRLLALPEDDADCTCEGAGRRPASADDRVALSARLVEDGVCGGSTGRDCSRICACEVPQASGDELVTCQSDVADAPRSPETGGPVNAWCYVDPQHGFGAPQLVADCPGSSPRNLRLLGAARPRGERLVAVCGSSCNSDE